MKFPIVLCSNDTLIIAPADFFNGIGRLDLATGILEMNVTRAGRAGLKWMLDADGDFYELTSLGLLPLSLLQRIRLQRPREKFRIFPGRRISVGELTDRISGMHNQFEEAPNVSDLGRLLESLNPADLVGPEEMSRHLGIP